MVKKLLILLTFGLVGCDETELRQRQLSNQPFKIAETNGVILWKVQDETLGGASYAYFTTPNGDAYWSTGGKHPQYHVVGGLPNGARILLEDPK